MRGRIGALPQTGETCVLAYYLVPVTLCICLVWDADCVHWCTTYQNFRQATPAEQTKGDEN